MDVQACSQRRARQTAMRDDDPLWRAFGSFLKFLFCVHKHDDSGSNLLFTANKIWDKVTSVHSIFNTLQKITAVPAWPRNPLCSMDLCQKDSG